MLILKQAQQLLSLMISKMATTNQLLEHESLQMERPLSLLRMDSRNSGVYLAY